MPVQRPVALITYDGLPTSAGGGHTLRGKDRRAIWNRMRRFLESSTTCEDPDDVRLLLAEGPHVNDRFFTRADDAAMRAFGNSRRRVAIGGVLQEREHAWTLPPSRISDALALLDELEPIPEHLRRGLLVLSIEARFFLRDPRNGEPLPGQGPHVYGDQEAAFDRLLGQSQIHLRLTSRSTCAIFLSLPFEDVTVVTRTVIAQLSDALPFPLSRSHWSRWQLNAQGTRYYKRRISVGDD